MNARKENPYVILRDLRDYTLFLEKWIYVLERDLRDFTCHVSVGNPGLLHIDWRQFSVQRAYLGSPFVTPTVNIALPLFPERLPDLPPPM